MAPVVPLPFALSFLGAHSLPTGHSQLQELPGLAALPGWEQGGARRIPNPPRWGRAGPRGRLRGRDAHGRVCCSYRNLATEHEALMQKYLHLLQIVETEKTVAKQLRQQIEDGEIEIERLKAEVKRPRML